MLQDLRFAVRMNQPTLSSGGRLPQKTLPVPQQCRVCHAIRIESETTACFGIVKRTPWPSIVARIGAKDTSLGLTNVFAA